MFIDFLDYPWVLMPYRYESLEELLVSLEDEFIAPQLTRHKKLRKDAR
jgi:hypothetical protein